jgi:uncharacterized protein (TIGR02444 family)
MTESDPEADLWRFAISVYGAEGVSEDCLKLQEAFGVDVPVILCTLWMATRGNALDPDGMARLAAAVGPWHDEVVKALREVRRHLKNGPAPALNDRTEILRNAVKAAELNAERLELAVLAELVEAEFAPGAAILPAQNLAVALAHYAGGPVGGDAPLDRLSSAAEAAAGG